MPQTPQKPMRPFAQKILSMPCAAQFMLAASLGALAFVFIMQYGFGLQPCELCLWERAPYGATALIAALAWGWRPYGRQTVILLELCAAYYLIGMGTAIFHTGVELHWWLGTAGCSISPEQNVAASDLRDVLLHTVSARCDEITWTFLGLSMTNWNIAASLILTVFATGAAIAAAQNTPRR